MLADVSSVHKVNTIPIKLHTTTFLYEQITNFHAGAGNFRLHNHIMIMNCFSEGGRYQ